MGLFDYGSGNLHSAARALTHAGADVTVTADASQLQRVDALVVPGVGAFAACMAGLRANGGPALISWWVESGRPLLGICVGHQVLFTEGFEHGVPTGGLGLLDGTVTRLPGRRLPHMGWNTIDPDPGMRLFAGIADERFYFVHSYAATDAPPGARAATAQHEGVRFVAALERDNVTSTQFHPEKSGAAGGTLLRNWLSGS